MNQFNQSTQFTTPKVNPLAVNSPRSLSKWDKLSLKTKGTLVATVLGLTPLVAIGVLSYFQINNSLKEQTIQTQKGRAAAIADKLNRFVFERNGDIEIVGSLPIFTNSRVDAISSAADKARLLDQFVTSYQTYDSIAAFDLKGNVIAQSKGAPLDNHLNRKYIQDVLKTGKTVISEPELSKTSGKYVVHFATPIKDIVTGQIIGVARNRAPIESFNVPLKNLADKSQDYHILDTRTNKVFISSNGEYTGKSADADILATEKGALVEHNNTVGDTNKNGAQIGRASCRERVWHSV